MANTLASSGFQISRRLDGAQPNYAFAPNAQIAYNNANKIAFGDPVKLLSTGFIDVMAVGGSSIFGIFMGCDYWDPNFAQYRFVPAWNAVSGLGSTQVVTARVVIDPMAVFRVQTSGGPMVQADVGQNIDILTGSSGAPSAAGISTCSIDFTTLQTTSTLPFRVVAIVPFGSINYAYDPTLANNFAEVVMNTNTFTSRTGI
jgi:hypothetical protein